MSEIKVIDTDQHGAVVLLDSGGAVGVDGGVITVYKTGSHDETTGAVRLSLEFEWAEITRDEAQALIGVLAERQHFQP
ncbi:MAG TPA: hypothetical protein VHN16_01940 [Streptosporangiaceae bacterium]|nr:hypothetical protein [Streptosporangiaceae bacterium]